MCLQKADRELMLENETLEDLQTGGIVLLQKKDGFRFGVDAVLLADFAKDFRTQEVLDLCTGGGIIPMLLSAKTDAKRICGLEIQQEVYEMACRSVRLNELSDKVQIACGDLKKAAEIYGKRSFGLITCNPPYMPAGKGIKNELDTKIIARHEVLCTLEDVIAASAQVLKQQGHLMLVHKPSRLVDIMCLMRKYDIELKRVRFIHKKTGTEPSLILVDGAYKGGSELRIMPPLYLYNDDGSETDELKRIYGR